MQNYYQILGVGEAASGPEIKAAYKKLAMLHHPDRNQNNKQAEEKFKQINNAYQILSDPQRRAHYDLVLNYQHFQTTATYTDQGTSYSSSYTRSTARSTATGHRANRPGYSYKDRQKAEKESFAIASLVIISMLMVVGIYIGITSYIEMRKTEEEQAYRESQMSRARMYFEGRQFRASLEEINLLINSWPGDMAYITFQEQVLQEIRKKADQAFNAEEYTLALEFFGILHDYDTVIGKELKYKLVKCYNAEGQYLKATALLKEIVRSFPDDISAYYELSQVYLAQQNTEEALKYVEHARNLAIRYYRNQYGEAYAILVDPGSLSDVHYLVFYNHALINSKMGKFEAALRDCSWATFLRPEYGDIHLLKGDCEFAIGQRQKACQSWQTAASLGMEAASGNMASHCR